jgi:hypothetical protein
MVAYSFKPRFEMPIVTLRKTGTIRAHGRRRHARPGERLQLYTGMRTRSCRLLATAECQSSDRLRVWFDTPRVIVGEFDPGLTEADINHCYALTTLPVGMGSPISTTWRDSGGTCTKPANSTTSGYNGARNRCRPHCPKIEANMKIAVVVPCLPGPSLPPESIDWFWTEGNEAGAAINDPLGDGFGPFDDEAAARSAAERHGYRVVRYTGEPA